MMRLLRLLFALALMLPVVLFVISNRDPITLRLWPLPGAIDPPIFTQMQSFPLMLMLVLLGVIALLGRHFD